MAEHLPYMPVEPVEAVFRTHPYKAPVILQYAEHRVVREAVLYLVMPEVVLLSLTVHACQ